MGVLISNTPHFYMIGLLWGFWFPHFIFSVFSAKGVLGFSHIIFFLQITSRLSHFFSFLVWYFSLKNFFEHPHFTTFRKNCLGSLSGLFCLFRFINRYQHRYKLFCEIVKNQLLTYNFAKNLWFQYPHLFIVFGLLIPTLQFY